MDRNSIIGLVVIFLVLIGWSIYVQPSKEELAAKRKQDSIALVQREKEIIQKAEQQKLKNDKSNNSDKKDKNEADSVNKVDLSQEYGIFTKNVSGKREFFTIENDLIKLKISNKGGRIYSAELKNYKTFDSLPLILFDGDSSIFGLNFFTNNRNINTNDLFFLPYYGYLPKGTTTLKVTGKDSLTFAMRMYADTSANFEKSNKYIEYVYTLKGDDYMLGMQINFVGMQNIISANTNYLNLDWKIDVKRQEKSLSNEQISSTIYYKYTDNEVDWLSESKDDALSLKTRVKWLSYKQHFFTSVLISEKGFNSADIKTITINDSPRLLKTMHSQIVLPYVSSNNYSIPLKMYYGPNHYQTLKSYNLDLERQIPLGWGFFLLAWINKYAVIPVFNFLGSFGWNYGIIILILTILLKIVLFPISYKTYISTAKMKILKPEIDEINKKFPKEEALKRQQATMALYKKAGVSPLSGCIPLLLQLPILIAMFRFFPASIELRQQSFLWAHDLSSYDSIFDLPFNIPFYGDHVSLFTLLMTITTIIYTKINNDMMGSTNQMPGMKFFTYLMPIMFLGIFNNYSSGLSYYYFLVNILTFAQMYLMRFMVSEVEIHRRIQEHRKKPESNKKSGFQKRLEEMAKKKGYNMPKR